MYRNGIVWNRQKYSQSLVVKSGNINLSPVLGTKRAFRRWKIKENHNIKSKLVPKLYDENIIWTASIKRQWNGPQHRLANTQHAQHTDRPQSSDLVILPKLWVKLGENVRWVNTFSSLSPISLHFIRQNPAYRMTSRLVNSIQFKSFIDTQKEVFTDLWVIAT